MMTGLPVSEVDKVLASTFRGIGFDSQTLLFKKQMPVFETGPKPMVKNMGEM